MLRRAFSAAAARRARKAAVAALAPLVEGSRMRLNGIPDSAWLDPYLVGFMVTLINHHRQAQGCVVAERGSLQRPVAGVE